MERRLAERLEIGNIAQPHDSTGVWAGDGIGRRAGARVAPAGPARGHRAEGLSRLPLRRDRRDHILSREHREDARLRGLLTTARPARAAIRAVIATHRPPVTFRFSRLTRSTAVT